MRAVLDTHIILYLLGGRLAKPLPPGFYFVSVITEMELLSYPSLDSAAERQIRAFLSEITVIGLTDMVKTAAITIRRDYSLKLPDAIVVGTGVVLDADLLTNDAHLSRWGKQLKIR